MCIVNRKLDVLFCKIAFMRFILVDTKHIQMYPMFAKEYGSTGRG